MTEPGSGSVADIRWLDDPQISPAGTHVAYVELRLDRAADTVASRIGVVGATGGATRWLAAGDCPRWSPDGRRLAVVAHGDLSLVDVDSGMAEQLTDSAGATGWAQEPAWSPDGTRLAFTRTERTESPDGIRIDALAGLYRQRRQVHVMDCRGTPLWSAPEGSCHPQWSPGGSRLAYLTTGSRPDLCWTEADGGAVRVAGGPVRGYAWSPDGRTLAYLAHRHGDATDVNLRLYLADADADADAGMVAGEAVHVELSAGWMLGLGNPVRGDDPRGTGHPPVVWSAASGRIYVELAAGGRGPLAWFDTTGSGVLFDGEHVCLAPSAGGGRLAFVRTDPDSPGDILLAEESGGTPHQVTDANPGLDTVPTSPLPVVAPDGTPIDAWLTAPPGPGRRPLLVNIHGGPHGAVGWRFTAETQRLAAHGYAVLTLNPRGSQGYGEAFACAIRGGWGGLDWSDVEAVVDAAIRLPIVDSERLVIWGVSYGGFMAQWAITRTDRFCAAISENGISDFFGLWGTGATPPHHWSLPMAGTPWTSPRFVTGSPLAYADRVSTPLLLLHAEHDQVCSVAQSEQAYGALRALGRTVELVRIPGEGHLINLHGRPSSRSRRAAAIDSFLARYAPVERLA